MSRHACVREACKYHWLWVKPSLYLEWLCWENGQRRSWPPVQSGAGDSHAHLLSSIHSQECGPSASDWLQLTLPLTKSLLRLPHVGLFVPHRVDWLTIKEAKCSCQCWRLTGEIISGIWSFSIVHVTDFRGSVLAAAHVSSTVDSFSQTLCFHAEAAYRITRFAVLHAILCQPFLKTVEDKTLPRQTAVTPTMRVCRMSLVRHVEIWGNGQRKQRQDCEGKCAEMDVVKLLEEGGVTLKLHCQMMLIIVLCSPAHQSPCLFILLIHPPLPPGCWVMDIHSPVCVCAWKPAVTFTFHEQILFFWKPFMCFYEILCSFCQTWFYI